MFTLHSDIPYLEADLLIQRYGPVAEGDGIAETGLPLHCLLGKVHDYLGSLGVWVEEEWADGKGSANAATLDRQAPFGFVVTSVRCGWEGTTKRVYKVKYRERNRL